MKDIVKYQNELNTIPLRRFKPVEMNLLFSILLQMRDKKENVVRFSFTDLQKLSNYKQTARKQFIRDIVGTYRKILSLSFGRLSKDGKRGSFFNLFSRFDFDYDKDYIDIQISKNAIPLLNDLTQWVRFSLPEFNSLQSTYAKTAFRLFKQFRTAGYLYLDKLDFMELFDVPKSYTKEANIDKRIFKPIKLELSGIFPNLKITKRHSNHRGKPVIGYEFTWKPESNTKNDLNVFSNEQNMQNVDNITKNENLSDAEKNTSN